GVDDGKHTDAKGGGGDLETGNGKWGDKPPMTPELFPDRSGFKSEALIKGDGDTSKPYTPPRHFVANADFPMAKRFQTVIPYEFSKYSPSIYYASATRDKYPGAWGHGFYLLYPYPPWAYGLGQQLGPTFYPNLTYTELSQYKSYLRNMTVLDSLNIPLVGDYDIFSSGKNVGFTDYNNGTVEIKPCADTPSSALGVTDDDCKHILLDLVRGSVVSGNAETEVQSEFTMFKLKLGQKEAVLRTVTISSTYGNLSEGTKLTILSVVSFFATPALIFLCFCLYAYGSEAGKRATPYAVSAYKYLKKRFWDKKQRNLDNNAYEALDGDSESHELA
ncbi:hypothetical protein H4R99_005539, partial [Coemansia sp. RSA 1722]